MPSSVEIIGAVDATVIHGDVQLVDHKVLEESATTPGSEMLLRIVLSIDSMDHSFLVGGYWSTKGFTMSMMTLVGRTPPIEAKPNHHVDPLVHGVVLSKTTAVQQDLVQRIVNVAEIGRPDNPQEPFVSTSIVDRL